jgi:hypothetical protein
MSATAVGSSPRKLSGAENAGVSASRDAVCSPPAAMMDASPKSDSPTMPKRFTRMFAGLMSRCSTPAWCAAASPSAIFIPMSRTCPAGMGPFLRSASFSEPAGQSSVP